MSFGPRNSCRSSATRYIWLQYTFNTKNNNNNYWSLLDNLPKLRLQHLPAKSHAKYSYLQHFKLNVV